MKNIRIQTFSGPSEKEAFARVRGKMGSDAIILSARRVKRRGVLGWLGRRKVEVEACSAEEVRSYRKTVSPSYRPILPPQAPSPKITDTQLFAHLLKELQGVKSSVEQLNGKVRASDLPGSTSELQEVYRQLVAHEVAEDLAKTLVGNLNDTLPAAQQGDPQAVRDGLRQALERMIPSAGALQLRPGTCVKAAFVGPTGVGKTTTIAKVAAQLRLKDRASVALVTIDTYRLAAVEQLRTYANILEIPIRVADSPAELQRAIRELASHDVVLIDTAGRSPKDGLKLGELKAFLEAAQVDETHLVLSLASDPKGIQGILDNFMPLGITHVLFSKMDEAERFGLVLNVMSRVSRSMSYITYGQNVPQDLAPGRSAHLAKLILGEEKL